MGAPVSKLEDTAQSEELEAENKKLKAKVKELKGSGGAVSTSTVGARSEVADSLQLEQAKKKWRGEFDREIHI